MSMNPHIRWNRYEHMHEHKPCVKRWYKRLTRRQARHRAHKEVSDVMVQLTSDEQKEIATLQKELDAMSTDALEQMWITQDEYQRLYEAELDRLIAQEEHDRLMEDNEYEDNEYDY